MSQAVRNHPVDSPFFAIEMDAGSESVSFVESLIVGGVKALLVDAEVPQEALYHVGVSRRLLEGLTAPVTDERSATGVKLVALGVAPEIVVVVENEDARLRLLFSIEVRGRQPAQASPHDDEVVDIGIGLLYDPPAAPAFEGELEGGLEGTDMTPAQSRECRRIAGRDRASALQREHLFGERPPREQRAGRQGSHPVQEISARNGAIHPEVAVCGLHLLSLSDRFVFTPWVADRSTVGSTRAKHRWLPDIGSTL